MSANTASSRPAAKGSGGRLMPDRWGHSMKLYKYRDFSTPNENDFERERRSESVYRNPWVSRPVRLNNNTSLE